MNRTLARLARMGPDEIRVRAQQALSKRWGRPPAFEAISCAAEPLFPDFPIPYPLPQAEKICRHRFDLLGYKDLDFGSPIDWHFDPVHHKRSPRKPWYQIPFLDFDQVGDHKIVWELNRHQHLVTLAEAWRLHQRRPLRRRAAVAVGSLAARKSLPHGHQLGQHAGSRLPRAVVALGPPLTRRLPRRLTARSPPSRLAHRALSVHLLLSQYALTGRRRGTVLDRSALPANSRRSPLAGPRLEHRPAPGRNSGPPGWFPLRAIRLLPHLRAGLLPIRARSCRQKRHPYSGVVRSNHREDERSSGGPLASRSPAKFRR